MRLPVIIATATLISTVAFAQQYTDNRVLTSLSGEPLTITNWYKQNVYDPSDNKVGEIEDVLVEQKDGHVAAFIIGVGGFLGIGEKHVAVPFNGVKAKKKDNNSWYLTTNATKDDLRNATGFRYDKASTTWVAENKNK
jgi:sporulation protein YlmC with PRC-barrel domain